MKQALKVKKGRESISLSETKLEVVPVVVLKEPHQAKNTFIVPEAKTHSITDGKGRSNNLRCNLLKKLMYRKNGLYYKEKRRKGSDSSDSNSALDKRIELERLKLTTVQELDRISVSFKEYSKYQKVINKIFESVVHGEDILIKLKATCLLLLNPLKKSKTLSYGSEKIEVSTDVYEQLYNSFKELQKGGDEPSGIISYSLSDILQACTRIVDNSPQKRRLSEGDYKSLGSGSPPKHRFFADATSSREEISEIS